MLESQQATTEKLNHGALLLGYQIKEDKMCREFTMHGEDDKHEQNFSQKTWKEETKQKI